MSHDFPNQHMCPKLAKVATLNPIAFKVQHLLIWTEIMGLLPYSRPKFMTAFDFAQIQQNDDVIGIIDFL